MEGPSHPFRCAFKGIEDAISTQRHLRIHVVVAGFVALFGLLLGLPHVDLALLLMAIALVIITELLNTAVELTVDLVSPAFHPIARRAKDIAAGAVLIAALAAATVGIIVLAPPLFGALITRPLSAKSALLVATTLGLVGSIIAVLLPRPSKCRVSSCERRVDDGSSGNVKPHTPHPKPTKSAPTVMRA